MFTKIKKLFKKTTMVGFSALSILCSVALILPIKKANAGNVNYEVLDYEWKCTGCFGNCFSDPCDC